MSELHVYTFEAETFRVVVRKGVPWFVVADIKRCLGLKVGSHSHTGMLPGEISLFIRYDPSVPPELFSKKARRVLVASEAGVRKLVTRSQSPTGPKLLLLISQVILPSLQKAVGPDIPTDDLYDAGGASIQDALAVRRRGEGDAFDVVLKIVRKLHADRTKVWIYNQRLENRVKVLEKRLNRITSALTAGGASGGTEEQ